MPTKINKIHSIHIYDIPIAKTSSFDDHKNNTFGEVYPLINGSNTDQICIKYSSKSDLILIKYDSTMIRHRSNTDQILIKYDKLLIDALRYH